MSYLYVLFNCSYGGAGGHSVRTFQFAEFREALVGTAQANKVQEGCREFINFYRPFTGLTIKITTVCTKIALKKSIEFSRMKFCTVPDIRSAPKRLPKDFFNIKRLKTTQALQALHAPHTSLEPFKRFKTFVRLQRRLRKA